MPLCGRATARNCTEFPDCIRSHSGSCSLEGPRLSRGKLSPSAEFCPLFCADDAGVRGCELTSLPYRGAAETYLHQTLIEALSP